MSEYKGNDQVRDSGIDREIFGLLVKSRLQAEKQLGLFEANPGKQEFHELKKSVRELHRLSWTKFRRTSAVEPPDFILDDNNNINPDLENVTPSQCKDLLNKYAVLHEELNLWGNMKRQFEEEEMGSKKKR